MSARVAGPMDNAIAATNKAYDKLQITLESGTDPRRGTAEAQQRFDVIHAQLTQGLSDAYTNGKADLDSKDGRRMADEILPMHDMRTGLENIKKVDDASRSVFVRKEKQEFD